MSLREEERLSAEALKAHLLSSGDYSSVEWSGVEHDPPDLEFLVTSYGSRSQRWAVEVTGLFQYADCEGAEITRLAFEPRLQRMIEKFRTTYRDTITMSYGLWIDGPLPNKG